MRHQIQMEKIKNLLQKYKKKEKVGKNNINTEVNAFLLRQREGNKTAPTL